MSKSNPFQDKKGNIQFPLEPTLDRVFILPSPPPEKFHGSSILIPDMFQEYYKRGIGILLAVGPGYYDVKGKWHPTSPQLKVGAKVCYDVSVPWEEILTGLDGKQHAVVLCGNADVYGVFEEC